MTIRKSRSTRDRVKIFEAANGVCHICKGKITPADKWELEHQIALEAGGSDEIENLAPAHVACHKVKTADDHKVGAKIKRIRAKHIGAVKKKRKIPGRRFNGEPIL